MNREQILKQVETIICEMYQVQSLTEETRLDVLGLDLDSMQIVELIVHIEETFNVIIDYDVIFETVGDIIGELESILSSS